MFRLVAIHAHPDDESSKGAATVAKYVDAGARAVLVTATGGEAGDILNPAMDRPEVARNLAAVRRGELDAAAAIIGYQQVEMLGYRDSGMADTDANHRPDAFVNVPEADVMAKLVSIVRRERPHVLLGYDAHERYPHPDHLLVHKLSLALFAAAADPQFPDSAEPWAVSKLFAPVFSSTRAWALHGAMLARGVESPFAEWIDEIPQDRDVGKRLVAVDVSATITRGREALLAHRTQVDPEGYWFRVPEEVVREAYPYEDFELLASRVPIEPDEKSLFDGIAAL